MILSQVKTQVNLVRNRKLSGRKLEIGPGDFPLEGFESLNVVDGRWVDYIADAAKKLPFDDDAFELVFASHILEHIPWYKTGEVLAEWRRILAPGGRLEVWVPNGLKICQAFVEAETQGSETYKEDGWFRMNEQQDPCTWAAGRLFTYGDGEGTVYHPNWHRAMFSPRRLTELFNEAGFENVRQMTEDEVRGPSHGWINLGVCGEKA